MPSIYDIASWFLSIEPMTNKKLQKLVYYAYAWSIVLLRDKEDSDYVRLFDERLEAWVHGPVCPPLYGTYKSFGWNDIPKSDSRPTFSEDIEELLQEVWESYGKLSAYQLEELSHREDPWINARKGLDSFSAGSAIIDDNDILCYFNKLIEND